MKIRKKLKAKDISLIAHSIVKATTEQKNPDAVTIGSIGGKKGGKSRAKKLTPEQRHAIAKLAAEARWRKANY